MESDLRLRVLGYSLPSPWFISAARASGLALTSCDTPPERQETLSLGIKLPDTEFVLFCFLPDGLGAFVMLEMWNWPEFTYS